MPPSDLSLLEKRPKQSKAVKRVKLKHIQQIYNIEILKLKSVNYETDNKTPFACAFVIKNQF